MKASNYSSRLMWFALLIIVALSWSGAFTSGSLGDWLPEANAAEETVATTATIEESSEPELKPAPKPTRKDYPNVGTSSRSIVWIVAQMHLFFGALVLAVPIFVIAIELLGVYTGDQRYDDMAHEFMKISITAYSITALFGGTLALALFLLYPDFMAYMMNVFGAQMLVYAILFFLESIVLYIYYYGWDALRYGNAKWVHLSLGLLLNGVGATLMVTANSWSTFMMAPSGVNEVGAVIGNIWEVMKGPLWNPINLHRFIANIVDGLHLELYCHSRLPAFALRGLLANGRDLRLFTADGHYRHGRYSGLAVYHSGGFDWHNIISG